MKEKTLKSRIINTITAIILIFTAIYGFISCTNIYFSMGYDIYEVVGGSMKATFNAESTEKEDERNDMLILKLNVKEYSRGDVISYYHNDEYIVKRIIALGGDRIKIAYDSESDRYCFFLNGEVLQEDYIAEEYSSMEEEKILFDKLYKYNHYNCRQYFDEDGYLVVPEGYVFYAGDNRINSLDCTTYGPQTTQNIIGKYIYKFSKSEYYSKVEMFKVKCKVLYGSLFKILKQNFN